VSSAVPSVEEFSRPAKALIDSGAVSDFDEAAQILTETCPTIVAGPDAVSYAHQAALLTAVETTARTFGQARVHLPTPVAEAMCTVPGLTDITVAEAVVSASGRLVELNEVTAVVPTIVIGTAPRTSDPTLQVTWDQWFAHVNVTGRHLPERGNVVLAPVAAAALAVTECFKRALGAVEACYRNRSLNLWHPDSSAYPARQALPAEVIGPDLRHLPSAVWMVGLGHLGQGFAWCWRLLPYLDPTTCEIQLQDFDKVNAANWSTGMFIRPADEDRMKARVVSTALERAGFSTRIIERRLLADTRHHTTDPALALIGVDKVEPRRIISDIGWTFAVDVGLGAGPIDFGGISIHTFPAPRSSHDVPAWQGPRSTDRATRAQEQDAYRAARAAGADLCGLVQLAETAVAAPFVGVVAGCIAVAEPLRMLHGQHPHSTLSFDAGRIALPRSTPGDARPRFAFQAARPSSCR
jgi:hypothetical protein